MASAPSSNNSPADTPSNSRGPSRNSRGGRNRRGGGAGAGGGEEGNANRSRGGNQPRRGQGGPRVGRGGSTNGARGPAQNPDNAQAPVQRTVEIRPKPEVDDDAESVDDEDCCFICANPLMYRAILPCNHNTCHICIVRMRALYKSKACPHCRSEAEFVIVSKHADKLFKDFTETDIVSENQSLGIKFDDQQIATDTTLLLQYNCPEDDCGKPSRSWPDLHRHVQTDHKKKLCDLCTRHKKVFCHEHVLFAPAELKRHEKFGDDVHGSETQSGFTGHPECEFCRTRFYSADELYDHCRHNHERCHICDRRPGSKVQYYLNYDTLEEHFRSKHYACLDRECLEKKFVVFDSELDLKGHQLEAHPESLSKEGRRDARRVDISTFHDSRPRPEQSNRREGRGGRNRDATRGHQEPQEQPIRTEQNMSRAEIAYHRQLAIQSSQSTTSRTFGGQLSEPSRPEPRTQTIAVPVQRPVSTPPVAVAATNAFPSLASSRRPSPSNVEPTRQSKAPVTEEVRRLKHTAVIERASSLLRGDQQKLGLFRANITNFRTGKISGDAVVDNFWALFDVTAADLGKLLNELSELYENEQKRSELLKAWNNWKAINEDYPPIAGTPHSTASASTSHILKIKSSTARSGRSSTAQRAGWGAASSSYNASPAFNPTPAQSNPTPAQSNPNRAGRAAHTATPWVSSGSNTRPPAVSTVPRTAATMVSSSSSSRPPVRKDEFPGLPPKKVTPGWTPVQKKGNSWDPVAPSGSAWNPEDGEEQYQDDEAAPSRGGKKKKGKQILFKIGL